MSSAVAAGGVLLLALLAPFEATAPLLRLPWQSLSNLEAVLLVACGSWAVARLASSAVPRRIPLIAAWTAFIVARTVAALASTPRANALHMTGRFAAAAAVYVLTVEGVTTPARLRMALTVTVATGLGVAVLALLEWAQVRPVLQVLRWFRPATTSVGGLVRVGGPLQYPTIASMYLEIVFEIGRAHV